MKQNERRARTDLVQIHADNVEQISTVLNNQNLQLNKAVCLSIILSLLQVVFAIATAEARLKMFQKKLGSRFFASSKALASS